MPRATLDPSLSVRVLSTRELRYDDKPALGEDRPAHVRAASGIAMVGGRLVVIQDDCAFIGFVTDEVTAMPLPRGPNGRRRFEDAIGNKADKLDLEACVVVPGDRTGEGQLGDELWAFGSGVTPMREKILVYGFSTHLHDASPLYRRLREELAAPSSQESFRVAQTVNIEGAALVGKELWLFHRGNTGPHDPGPMVFKLARAAVQKWIASAGTTPEVDASIAFDLGDVDGHRIGFTDAVAVGARVFFLAAAESSPNAIDDGRVLASKIGVIESDQVRMTTLEIDGKPIKAEGIAFDPKTPTRAWITIDPDDVAEPAKLYEIELVGPW
ncbi:MAG TPA: hypothetical protein VL326_30165 [Kofleriaceae bacterium]|nr:hypothetical protein [Kofleriaceae bacterium]